MVSIYFRIEDWTLINVCVHFPLLSSCFFTLNSLPLSSFIRSFSVSISPYVHLCLPASQSRLFHSSQVDYSTTKHLHIKRYECYCSITCVCYTWARARTHTTVVNSKFWHTQTDSDTKRIFWNRAWISNPTNSLSNSYFYYYYYNTYSKLRSRKYTYKYTEII